MCSARRSARILYYLVSFSQGAGAEPLPECEDTCPPGQGALPGGQVSSQNPFFFHFAPPAAAQNEN